MTDCPQVGLSGNQACSWDGAVLMAGGGEAPTWQWAEARPAGPLSPLSLQPSSPSAFAQPYFRSLFIPPGRLLAPSHRPPRLCLCLQGPGSLCFHSDPHPPSAPRARLQTQRRHICPNPNPAHYTAPSRSRLLALLLTWESERAATAYAGGEGRGGMGRGEAVAPSPCQAASVCPPTAAETREAHARRSEPYSPQSPRWGSPTCSKTSPLGLPARTLARGHPRLRPRFQIALQAPPRVLVPPGTSRPPGSF